MMSMKKLCLYCIVVLASLVSLANVYASPVSSIRCDYVAVEDGGDVDLYLDCFEKQKNGIENNPYTTHGAYENGIE